MTEKIAQDSNSEIDRLTIKCNMQLDHINEQEKTIAEQARRIKELENTTANNVNITSILNSSGKAIFVSEAELFYISVADALKSNSFFESKRITENSVLYMTIDYNVITQITARYTTIDNARINIKKWAEIGYIYRDKYGAYIVNHTQKGKTIRSIRINRTTVELIKECALYD